MENELQPIPPDAHPAAVVFARLTEEVGVVRRLVAANDNTVTLGEIVQRLDRMVDAINVLARRPAMKLTPDQMAEQIAAAGQKARAEDGAAITQARERMEKTAKELDRSIGKAATIREQHRRLVWMGGGGLLAGVLLWSFLPGTIARTAPESWHWPERMAAHIMGVDRWGAGERLFATANPDHWHAVVLRDSIVGGNAHAVAAYLRAAAKQHKPVHCTVMIASLQPQI